MSCRVPLAQRVMRVFKLGKLDEDGKYELIEKKISYVFGKVEAVKC